MSCHTKFTGLGAYLKYTKRQNMTKHNNNTTGKNSQSVMPRCPKLRLESFTLHKGRERERKENGLFYKN